MLFRLVLFLLFIQISFGVEVVYKDNTGGLNSKASPLFLKENQSSDLRNINLDTDGAIVKRNGYTQSNTTALPDQVDGLFSYTISSGTSYMIAAANNIYKMDSFDGTWDDITGSTAITADTPARARTFDDKIIITNGADIPQEWAGSSTCSDNDCNSDITLTKAKYIEIHDNRVMFANVTVGGTDYPNSVYFSAIGDESDWSALNYINVQNDDGDQITGMVSLNGYNYIFRKNDIWKMRGTGDSSIPFSLEKTFSTIGCIAPDSIQKINDYVIFLSRQGLALFDGSYSKVISYNIAPTLQELDQNTLVAAKSAIYYKRNQYWLSVSDGDSADRIIIWDYFHNAFLVHDGISACSLLSIIDSSEEERFYFGDFSGYAYRYDQGYDDYPAGTQTAINAYYYTKHYDLGSLLRYKAPLFLLPIFAYSAVTSTLQVYYSYDLQETDMFYDTISLDNPNTPIWDIALWDVDTWGGSGATYYRMDLKGQGITVRFKFQNRAIGETFSIYGWAVGYDQSVIVDN